MPPIPSLLAPNLPSLIISIVAAVFDLLIREKFPFLPLLECSMLQLNFMLYSTTYK